MANWGLEHMGSLAAATGGGPAVFPQLSDPSTTNEPPLANYKPVVVRAKEPSGVGGNSRWSPRHFPPNGCRTSNPAKHSALAPDGIDVPAVAAMCATHRIHRQIIHTCEQTLTHRYTKKNLGGRGAALTRDPFPPGRARLPPQPEGLKKRPTIKFRPIPAGACSGKGGSS